MKYLLMAMIVGIGIACIALYLKEVSLEQQMESDRDKPAQAFSEGFVNGLGHPIEPELLPYGAYRVLHHDTLADGSIVSLVVLTIMPGNEMPFLVRGELYVDENGLLTAVKPPPRQSRPLLFDHAGMIKI